MFELCKLFLKANYKAKFIRFKYKIYLTQIKCFLGSNKNYILKLNKIYFKQIDKLADFKVKV